MAARQSTRTTARKAAPRRAAPGTRGVAAKTRRPAPARKAAGAAKVPATRRGSQPAPAVTGLRPSRSTPMQVKVTGQQIEVTQALRDYVNEKIGRVSRHFEKTIEAHVVLGVEKLKHHAEATIKASQRTIHAEADGIDMYAAIDVLSDKLDTQVRKHKEKLKDHHRAEAQKTRPGA
jgi:putative sigma-54 modulation protein